jgi:hypothetical protein
MIKFLIGFIATVFVAWLAFVLIPEVHASPGQCGQGYALGSGGGFCDGPMLPDGTWFHCESVYVLGFGGTNCFYVRPVPLDVDPRGWVPA